MIGFSRSEIAGYPPKQESALRDKTLSKLAYDIMERHSRDIWDDDLYAFFVTPPVELEVIDETQPLHICLGRHDYDNEVTLFATDREQTVFEPVVKLLARGSRDWGDSPCMVRDEYNRDLNQPEDRRLIRDMLVAIDQGLTSAQ